MRALIAGGAAALCILAGPVAAQVEPLAAQQADEVRGRELSWAEGGELPKSVEADFDGDGVEDSARVGMRPHSMRHDLDFILNGQGHSVIAAAQPNRGALVHRGARLAPPGAYAIACERHDGEDVAPCAPAEVVLAHPGVDLYAPGGLRVLVWRDGEAFRVARLAEPDVEP